MTEVIVKITRKGQSFIARPAKAPLRPGDTFILENKTDQPMVFRLESRVPFGNQRRLVEVGERGKTMKRRARRPSWRGQREYPYQILMIESGRKAKGNSDPVIVIDNP